MRSGWLGGCGCGDRHRTCARGAWPWCAYATRRRGARAGAATVAVGGKRGGKGRGGWLRIRRAWPPARSGARLGSGLDLDPDPAARDKTATRVRPTRASAADRNRAAAPAATKMRASDRVVALSRTPARRPRLPPDLDVFVAPRLQAFDAYQTTSTCTTKVSKTRVFKRQKSPVKGFGQTALF
ncbi:hypothetical protein PAHAL_5G159100 [Panicum hallii]|uniref:Uncharacterized protein n=1 Tax=Panicum hallii TaxID=206008 RepID=A0A2T8IK46_9POAL|nr:hypothetical protein PAHAL_5G159100 [Panicum hallii]